RPDKAPITTTKPMWERACSRMQWISQPMYWLIHCIREQARSHILIFAARKVEIRTRDVSSDDH
ncbi:hypothetical protein F1720_27140, partial [Pseudomonas brenneri]